MFPRFSRCVFFLSISVWSIALAHFWQLSTMVGVSLSLFGLWVGARFMLKPSVASDKTSYVWYNVRPSTL